MGTTRRGISIWGTALATAATTAWTAACGAGGAPGGGEAAPGSRAPVTFSFWNMRQFGPMEERLIALYREQHPHVTVEYLEGAKQGITAVGGSAEEAAALVVRATAGGTIDVAKVEASRTPFALWTKKALLGLNKYGGDKAAASLLNTELMQFAGNTWGLTYEASVRGLAYSGTAFKVAGLDPDRPPQTWTQVIEQGARLTQAPDRYAYIFPINNLLKTVDQAWMNGGEIVDRTYLPTKATFTAPKVQEVYQFQYDLVHKYGISPSTALSNPNLGGLVTMSYDDAGNIPTWRARQPEADWRMTRMFRQRAEYPCHSGAAGSSLVLFGTSQAPEAAAAYMTWLVSEEVQRIHALITPAGADGGAGRHHRHLPRTQEGGGRPLLGHQSAGEGDEQLRGRDQGGADEPGVGGREHHPQPGQRGHDRGQGDGAGRAGGGQPAGAGPPGRRPEVEPRAVRHGEVSAR